MAERSFALTTIDNPYDPIDDFDNWLNYDMNVLKYNSMAYLDRVTHISDELTDEENEAELERGIDEIVLLDFTGLYKKVEKVVKNN